MADEKKLLLRLKNKDVKAVDEAIEIYTPYLSTVLYNMVGNRLSKEDVEEIVSDVFVVLWQNADYIDLEKGTVKSYLAVTARNFALKRLNKRKDCVCLDEVDLADDGFAENALNADFLWNAVMSLGELDNELFVRYYKFDEKLKGIAKETGLNISTVKTKLSRGKRKLKKILSNAEEML